MGRRRKHNKNRNGNNSLATIVTSSAAGPSMENQVNGSEKILRGDDMAEIVLIRVVDLGGKSSSKIHGTITLIGVYQNDDIFFREKENPLTVELNGLIPIIGPTLPIVAYDPYGLRIRLGEEKDEESLCQGIVSWNSYIQFSPIYDRPITKFVKSPNLTIETTFITFTEAIIAELELKLVRIENRAGDVRIYGDTHAHFRKRDLRDLSVVLFCRKEDESESMRVGEVIKLDKTLMSMPRFEDVEIRADIWELNGGQLAEGKVGFGTVFCGDYVGIIEGEGCDIEVKVRWFPMSRHPPTTAATFSGM